MVTQVQKPGPTLFASTLIPSMGSAAYDTSAEIAAIIQANTANTAFTKIFEMVVPAQQIIGFGSGTAAAGGGHNQGYMHFFALDVGTGFEEGQLRLVVANARETRSTMIQELNTQRLHTTTSTNAITATPTDINTMVALPLNAGPKAAQDDLIQLWFKTTIPTTTVDACEFSIPITIWQ
jgi:hypothetical protein